VVELEEEGWAVVVVGTEEEEKRGKMRKP